METNLFSIIKALAEAVVIKAFGTLSSVLKTLIKASEYHFM